MVLRSLFGTLPQRGYCHGLQTTSQFALGLFVSVSLGIATWTNTAHADIARLWAVDDGTKVFQSDLKHPLANGNGVFSPDSKKVALFGARNETVAFQLVFAGGDTKSDVVLSPLALSSADFTIKNENGTELGSANGRNIEMFREHYVKITERSRGLGWATGTDSAPTGFENALVPDALIPLNPNKAFSVPKAANTAIWIDIYIPEKTPPGVYKGNLNASCAECSLEIDLEVLPLTLPHEPAVKTMLWFSGSDSDLDLMASRYKNSPEPDDANIAKLRQRHFQIGKKHGITMFTNHHEVPTPELESRLQGHSFSAKEGYRGWGQDVPQDFYAIHAYGSKDLSAKDAERWRDWFQKNYPKTDYFYYVYDEPGEDVFDVVNRRAREAKAVPAFVTTPYTPTLSVDIFASTPEEYSLALAKEAKENGKRHWIYNGVRPFSGSFFIDDVAVSPRVNSWIQSKYNIERWFYWEATYYKDAQGDRGQIDVLSRGDNFTNSHGDLANGDGLLLYPGTDLLFPKNNNGLAYPMPSIRLKNWRRGIQDAAYLKLARESGHSKFVDSLLEKLLPSALADDLDYDDPVSWPESGENWLEARRLLAQTLKSKKPAAIPASLGRPSSPIPNWIWLAAAGLLLLLFVLIALKRRSS